METVTNMKRLFKAALRKSTHDPVVAKDQGKLRMSNVESAMRGITSLIVFIVIVMFSATDRMSAQGARVEVLLNDGHKISGELLSVRESTLVVSCAGGELNKEGTSQKEDSFMVLSTNQIQEVFIEGKSYVGFGIGFGLVAGAGIGLAVGLANKTPLTGSVDPADGLGNAFRTVAFTIGGAGVGSIIGYVIGSQASSADKEVVTHSRQDMQTLKEYARFQSR